MEKGNGQRDKKLSLGEAVSMAVGTMIGASIFSIFGLGAKIAGHNLPEAFVLSGIYAFLVAYSYTKLGAKIVSNAGPIAFILKGFGDGVLTGTMGILMWLSYVVSLSLFAKGFAGYFLPLVHLATTPAALGITEVVVLSFFTALNFFGSKAVGRAEFYIVVVKLSILGIFIVLGILTIKPAYLQPAMGGEYLHGMFFASVIFFLSYMGFGLVTNASENIENPRRNVPLAIYLSIAIVIFVYVSVAVVAVGNLSLSELIRAQENALAVAARPFLGNLGFLLISIGALFSISSAMNATLYGGANIAYSLAKDGELPRFFERKVWFKSTEGLFVTAFLGFLFALLFNLGGVASITSAIFISIYFFVLISHYRNVKEIGGSRPFILFNLLVLLGVFAVLMYYNWQTQRSAFWGTLVTFAGAFAAEYLYRMATKRQFTRYIHRMKLFRERGRREY